MAPSSAFAEYGAGGDGSMQQEALPHVVVEAADGVVPLVGGEGRRMALAGGQARRESGDLDDPEPRDAVDRVSHSDDTHVEKLTVNMFFLLFPPNDLPTLL